jgi:hypothetical protein
MPAIRPYREKIFGPAPATQPLDRNAKARIMTAAHAYNARTKQQGQHWGPVTRSFFGVLRALLYCFQNDEDGRCFPSYERLAKAARCNRDTVCEAIKALESAGLVSWVHRITKIRVKERDLFGQLVTRWQVIRTSNAYVFRDPLPCAPAREGYKSENPGGPLNPELISKEQPPRIIVLDPTKSLDSALIRLGRAVGALEAAPG